MGRDFWRNCRREGDIFKYCRRFKIVFTAYELKPGSVSSRPFPFWFKDDFSVNISSSSTFQFSAYILSLDCQRYNCSSRDLSVSRSTKKG